MEEMRIPYMERLWYNFSRECEIEGEVIDMTNKKLYLLLILVGALIITASITVFLFGKNKIGNTAKPYAEIVTKNQGSYIVKNMVYTETSRDLTQIEKAMKEIRSECKKLCKINLYSDKEAYDLDIMAGESSFNGFTDEQRNYLATHVLAFWGIDQGDNIEYYPSK